LIYIIVTAFVENSKNLLTANNYNPPISSLTSSAAAAAAAADGSVGVNNDVVRTSSIDADADKKKQKKKRKSSMTKSADETGGDEVVTQAGKGC